MEEVKCDESQPARLISNGYGQCVEIGGAPLVGYNDLAVENGNPAWQHLGRKPDGPVYCGAVIAVLGVETHAASIDDDLRPVAVEFGLVNPSIPFGRLLDQCRDLRRNEFQPTAFVTLTQ